MRFYNTCTVTNWLNEIKSIIICKTELLYEEWEVFLPLGTFSFRPQLFLIYFQSTSLVETRGLKPTKIKQITVFVLVYKTRDGWAHSTSYREGSQNVKFTCPLIQKRWVGSLDIISRRLAKCNIYVSTDSKEILIFLKTLTNLQNIE